MPVVCAFHVTLSNSDDGHKKIYADFRRYLPLDHRFRSDVRTFDNRETRSTPAMRDHDDILRDAALAERAYSGFGIKRGSPSDPAQATGVTGESELLRLPYWDHVLMSPMDFMHVLVTCLVCPTAQCFAWQSDTTKRFFEQFKGARERPEAEDDDTTASSGSDMSDAKDSSDSSSDDDSRVNHIMTAEQQSLVERRLHSLILPARASSSAMRKPFKHTGKRLLCTMIDFCYGRRFRQSARLEFSRDNSGNLGYTGHHSFASATRLLPFL